MYRIVVSKRAAEHVRFLKSAHLENKVKELLKIIERNPFQNPPPYEKLVGDLAGLYARRINHQHRLVYQVDANENTVRVLSMWTHYETV